MGFYYTPHGKALLGTRDLDRGPGKTNQCQLGPGNADIGLKVRGPMPSALGSMSLRLDVRYWAKALIHSNCSERLL